MNVLEKILEEIKEKNRFVKSDLDLGYNSAVYDCSKIIRNYLTNCRDTNVTSNVGWIPVEDRLPEEGEEVEVTIEEMADSAGGMRYYTKTAWVQEERWVIKRNPCNPRVIAWRPLPEPYKAD